METKLDCIFCGKPKHLYVNTQKGLYYCQRCKKSGHLSELKNSIPSLINYPVTVKVKNTLTPIEKFKKSVEALDAYDNNHTHILNYAKRRGALKYFSNLFYHPDFPEYLVVGLPLGKKFDSITSFFGRKVIGEGTRYKIFTPCSKFILAKSFDEDDRSMSKGVVVEGFFDLCKTSNYLPTAALLGTNLKSKLEEVLKLPFQRYYIFLDWDAVEVGIELSFELGRIGKDSKIIHVYNDPDELDDKQLERILK